MADPSGNSDRIADHDYKVGYGKPPREHQFKSNDGRRPSAKRSPKNNSQSESVAALLDKPLKLNRRGKITRIHPHEAQIMSLGKRALDGGVRAMREFLIECMHAGLLNSAALVQTSNVFVIPDGVNLNILDVLLTQYGLPPWDPDVYQTLEDECQRDCDEITKLREDFKRDNDDGR